MFWGPSCTDQTCSNDLPGFEASGVCCPLSCGQCGGSGCALLGEGCCTSQVIDSGLLCSVTNAAPCIVDSDDGERKYGLRVSTYISAHICPIRGRSGYISRASGQSSASLILSSCSPCLSTRAVELCAPGIPGILEGIACCPSSCGSCGGESVRGTPHTATTYNGIHMPCCLRLSRNTSDVVFDSAY